MVYKTHYSLNKCHVKKIRLSESNISLVTCKNCLRKNKHLQVNEGIIREIVKLHEENPTHEEIMFHLEKTNIQIPKIYSEKEFNYIWATKDNSYYNKYTSRLESFILEVTI